MKLYAGRGYQVTSFVAICQTAGLPEHIVRTHYRDESQIFIGVLDRVREYVVEPVIEKIAKARKPRRKSSWHSSTACLKWRPRGPTI